MQTSADIVEGMLNTAKQADKDIAGTPRRDLRVTPTTAVAESINTTTADKRLANDLGDIASDLLESRTSVIPGVTPPEVDVQAQQMAKIRTEIARAAAKKREGKTASAGRTLSPEQQAARDFMMSPTGK
jgi:hypothetical protein